MSDSSDPSEEVYLSESQLQDFRSTLKLSNVIVGIAKEATDFAVESFLDFAESQLRLFKIKKSMIPQLVPEILKQLNEYIPDESDPNRQTVKTKSAKIEEGAFVGITATEALCGPITQATLKTFHHAGSAVSVSSGNEAIAEILNVKKNRKTFRTKVFFKQRLSFNQVYSKIHEFVSTTMALLILDRDIDDFSKEKAEYWHPTKVNTAVEESRKTYCESGDIFVRLYLNLDIMIERRIDMELLKTKLEDHFSSDLIVCSPLSLGIIDIFPDVNNAVRACIDNVINGQKDITDATREYANNFCTTQNQDKYLMLYIRNGVFPTLDEIIVKGINKISYFVPQVQNIFGSCIYQQVDYSADLWYYPMNKIAMYTYNIGIERLVEIFETFGYTVKSVTKFGVFVNKSGSDPRTYINKLLEDKSDDFQESKEYLVCNVVYAITLGTNLKEILKRRDIDPKLTMSNDFNEILTMFGVEACRNHVMSELNEYITASGQEIGSRHLFLLGDLMTYKGDLTAINYHGVAKQQEGILAKVAYERGFGILSNAANVGSIDEYFKGNQEQGYKNIMPTSTGILTGQFVSTTKAIVRPVDILEKLKRMKASGELKFFSPEQERVLEGSEVVVNELVVPDKKEKVEKVVFDTMVEKVKVVDQAVDIMNLHVGELSELELGDIKQKYIDSLYNKIGESFKFSRLVF